MTQPLSTRVLRYGQDAPLPLPVPLRAGPISLLYQTGDLRYLKLGHCEVIRRIYAAVRDRNWATILGTLREVEIDVQPDSFHIAYSSEHKQDQIDFAWRAEIRGDPDGSIQFSFDGEACTSFLRNRIGFCVLHPIPQCAGAPCRATYSNGTTRSFRLPTHVSADQPVDGLHDLRAVAHEVEPDLWAEIQFIGDTFETEDQRNWIDASFKTYCTPLSQPFPTEIKKGTRIRQQISFRLITSRPARPPLILPSSRAPVSLKIDKARVTRVPALGLCVSAALGSLSPPEQRRLRALHIDCCGIL